MKHRPKTVDDIDHFEEIRYEDQKKIRDNISSSSAILLPEPTAKGKKSKKRAASDTDGAASNSAALADFGIEYSKSSRAEW